MGRHNSAETPVAVHRGIAIFSRILKGNFDDRPEMVEFFCDVNDGERVWEIVSKTPVGVKSEIDIQLGREHVG